jgi:hypothetical protein
VTARALHSATLLPDGRVLIAGGEQTGVDSLDTAELYDPTNGSTTTTGRMSISRQAHSATLLVTGRVLIAGGYSSALGAFADTAELYDPQSRQFTSTGIGPLGEARQLHTATPLPDGRVLIVGGYGNGGALSSAELYDPASGQFTPTGPLTTARLLHQATLLADGRVLVSGGAGADFCSLSSAEIYDPASSQFTVTGEMSQPRQLHTATRLVSGQVLLAGGFSSSQASPVLASAELYDPASGRFSTAGTLLHARQRHIAAALPDGAVLLAGGQDADGVLEAELYRPLTVTVTVTVTPHEATLLVGGQLQLTATVTGAAAPTVHWSTSGGSITSDGRYTAPSTPGNYTVTATSVEEPGATAMVSLTILAAPASGPHSAHTETLLDDGSVLIVGGTSQPFPDVAQPVDTGAELWSPHTGLLQPTTGLATSRALHTATRLTNGQVLIVGGEQNGLYSLGTSELYDPASAEFQPGPPLTMPRQSHTATRLPNGQVLIVGGYDGQERHQILATAELYDPESRQFRPTGSLHIARQVHDAVLLADGQVLIVGGINDEGVQATAELYDPASETFTLVGEMQTPRLQHRATLLADGQVLITGGVDQVNAGHPALTSVELYDPERRSFRTAGPLLTARHSHTATLLGDGRVAIVGGGTEFAELTALASVEIYDPTTTEGQSFPATPLTHARQRHSATLLGDGTLLVIGGHAEDNVVEVERHTVSPFALPETVDFAANRGHYIGLTYTGMRFLDLNGDGHLDIYSEHTRRFALGDGDGSFAPLQDTLRSYESVVFGDVDGDHGLDAIAYDASARRYILLQGQTDGTFVRRDPVNLSAYLFLTIADLQGDGFGDLVYLQQAGGTTNLLVQLNNGDSTFGLPVVLQSRLTYIGELYVRDFNHDGHSDILNINYEPAQLDFLAGHGDGTFQPAVRTEVGTYFHGREYRLRTALGDVNGDGHVDVVATAYPFPSGGCHVILGNGDSIFQPTRKFPNALYGRPVVVDLDGDDTDEILLTHSALGVYHFDTSAGLVLRQQLSLARISDVAASGDIDGDGHPDVVAAYGDGVVGFLLRNRGDGVLLDNSLPRLPLTVNTTDWTLADVDRDGVQEILGIGLGGNTIHRIHTSTSPLLTTLATASFSLQAVAVADFDEDGALDLVAANPSSASPNFALFRGQGDGTFGAAETPFALAGADLVATDINQDGHIDLVAAAQTTTSAPIMASVRIRLGQGDGTFGDERLYLVTGYFESLVVTDLDGDGHRDLAILTRNAPANTGASRSDLICLFGDGTGQFTTGPALAPLYYSLNAIQAGDLNEDGRADLVFAYRNSSGGGIGIMLLSNADGSYRTETWQALGGSIEQVLPIDIDLDGHLNLVVATRNYAFLGGGYVSTTGLASIYRGRGDGSLMKPIAYTVGGFVEQILVQDTNQDGLPDLVVENGDYSFDVRGHSISVLHRRP